MKRPARLGVFIALGMLALAGLAAYLVYHRISQTPVWDRKLLPAEKQTLQANNLVKMVAEFYLMEHPDKTHADITTEALEGYCQTDPDRPWPMNPYTGQAIHRVGTGDAEYLGEFSYFIMKSGPTESDPDPYTDNIVVTYVPYRFGQGRGLTWIGGDCGGNYQFLAWGITPGQALRELRQRHSWANVWDP